MKKYLVVLASMLMVLAMAGGASAGSKDGAIPVSATVATNCTISGGSIDFGTVDAVTDAGGKSATVIAPTIKCTKGASVGVTDDGGTHFSTTPRMSDGTNFLAYTVSYDTPLTGDGIKTDIGNSLNLTASLAAGALDDVPAGSYSDTLTITITY